MEQELKEGAYLLTDGVRGIYVPFACIDLLRAMQAKLMVANDQFTIETTKECIAIISGGPEFNDGYWECFNFIEEEAVFVKDGQVFRIVQIDGDVFAEPDNVDTSVMVEVPW